MTLDLDPGIFGPPVPVDCTRETVVDVSQGRTKRRGEGRWVKRKVSEGLEKRNENPTLPKFVKAESAVYGRTGAGRYWVRPQIPITIKVLIEVFTPSIWVWFPS